MKRDALHLLYEAHRGFCAVKQMNPGQSNTIFTTINRAHYSRINSLFCAQIKSITSILTFLHHSDMSLHRQRNCSLYQLPKEGSKEHIITSHSGTLNRRAVDPFVCGFKIISLYLQVLNEKIMIKSF